MHLSTMCHLFLWIGQGGRLAIFLMSPKNTNLEENVKNFLPVKFRSAVSDEKSKFSANQRPGRPSWFSDRPKNIHLVEDVYILLPVKFRQILFSGFRLRRSLKSLSQLEIGDKVNVIYQVCVFGPIGKTKWPPGL